MKGVNKVILLGHLGRDPEVKYTQSGTAVARFSLATNERFKGKDGQWQDKTEWHNVVLWQRLAELAGEHLHKGEKVYIEGRLETRSWDKDGEKRYTTSIVASELVLLGNREPSEPTNTKGRAGQATSPNIHGVAVTDADIPF